jgi:hypothetical protein
MQQLSYFIHGFFFKERISGEREIDAYASNICYTNTTFLLKRVKTLYMIYAYDRLVSEGKNKCK